ncbi:MAG: AAA family ATPase, partial [Myxococcales bacterium]|nr:AAA family ATPase [Myxococcales bacterium]
RFFTAKRKLDTDPERGQRVNLAMRDILKESGLPVLSASTAELCEIEVPSAEFTPPPEVTFRRLIHIALLKLDFVDRRRAAERGTPLIDVTRWSITTGAAASEDDAGDDGEVHEGDEEGAPARRYWAGGFTDASRLERFIAENFWKIGWKRDENHPAAKRTWKRFASIRVGDYFAIKGLGGTHDLAVHYVGEVVAIDADLGRLELRRLDVPLFKGKGPKRRGAGNWHDTLVPVTRADVIATIFEGKLEPVPVSARAPSPDVGVPLNLILYGPPGTGKTYRITHDLIRRFERPAAQPGPGEALVELATELIWSHAVAVALQELGGEADVDALVEHPLLKAKYAAKPIAVPLRTRIWSTLGAHAIDGSQTVRNQRRFGDKLFDKRPGKKGVWFLADALPDELVDASRRARTPAAAAARADHTFVTFHQAYGYEDFIEGIRPNVEDAADDEDASLSYVLEDGVFMKAVRAAVRLAGYEQPLHDLCGLSREERAAIFEDAPRYAIFIDEINRGNVARIFGELITLLEEDKRLGEDNEIIVPLPYSKKRFGVPPNLHVIGTMNTADRSIEALDTALRRRFEFEELAPQPDLLDFTIEGDIDPEMMLRTINRRLEKLYDRDHCIGHAYLLALADDPSLENLKRVFRNKLIPLLQEYFFGDWGKIGLVLGKDFVRRRDPAGTVFADFDHDDHDALAGRPTWELADVDKLSNFSFRRIYELVADD